MFGAASLCEPWRADRFAADTAPTEIAYQFGDLFKDECRLTYVVGVAEGWVSWFGSTATIAALQTRQDWTPTTAISSPFKII